MECLKERYHYYYNVLKVLFVTSGKISATNSIENRPQSERLCATSKQQDRKLIRLAQYM